MLRLRSIRIVALLLCGGILGIAQTADHRSPPQYGQPPEDLANALVEMARASHVPLIAELVSPLPKIPTAEGVPLTADRLNDLVRQAPGYEWKMEGNTIHFYNKRVRQSPFNLLNLKFSRYAVPPDLSELKRWLPVQAKGLMEGYSGTGGITTGFGDSLLAKDRLDTITLENVTPLEVLVRVAKESPTFYTVLVFPTATLTKRNAEKVIWQWGSLKEKLQPLYVQSPKSPRSR